MKKFTLFIFVVGVLSGGGYFAYTKIMAPRNPNIPLDQQISNTNVNQEPHLVLDMPKEGDTLSSPFELKGKVKGWFFEGSFPVYLTDADGKPIVITDGIGEDIPVKAIGDWMTSEYVSFDQKISFVTDATDGFLVLQKDNPSDDRSLDEQVKIPVHFAPQDTMRVNVYLGNSVFNPNQVDCTQVYPVERVVPKSPKTATAALSELLKGVLGGESKDGYITSINPGVTLKSISVSSGTASVDFSSGLGDQVAGSCRVAAIRAEIEQTLKQFPTIQNVVILIDGVSEGILEP